MPISQPVASPLAWVAYADCYPRVPLGNGWCFEDQGSLITGIGPALSAVSEAVVAMQLTIRISAATRFSEVFYEELVSGSSLQSAVAEARRTLYLEESDGASWYVPTLYIRTREQKPIYFVGSRAGKQQSALPLPIS